MSAVFAPRWYQDEAEFAIFDYFARGQSGNPVVCMPTGTGKSVVIASFIRKVFSLWPNQRIMMLTHIKELIEQNAEKLQMLWPTAPIGIYSAGLNSRDMIMPILFGGVQSVAPAIERTVGDDTLIKIGNNHFGHRDLLIIDECHLLSDKEDSHYQYIITELLKINPYMKVIGFTATPYRMKMGMITENGIFTDICYDITDVRSFNRLIAEGFMSPLIAKPTRNQVNTTNISIRGGEFNTKQLENAVNDDTLIENIVREMIEAASDRSTWLIFATGIDNTERFADCLQWYGIDALPVHSKLKSTVNDNRLKAYKAGELRCVVSGQKLTTGFDHPNIDYIGDVNPTLSPGKHVQKLGRGTRVAPWAGKINCLYGDFAGNVRRLGPINDPKIPGKPSKSGGDAPVRLCEVCGAYSHATAKVCEACGNEFTFESKLVEVAGDLAPIKSDDAVIEYFDVQKVVYSLHEKKDKEGRLTKPPSIKVMYFCGLRMFTEYVLLEHGGMAAKRSRDWWRQRHSEEPPATTHQALQMTSQLREPSRIRVHLNLTYPEILSAEW